MQNIIVLDDEQEIADLLEVYLANEGYQVFKFYRAEGVLDCIQENEISLAILDVMLPDIDGFEVCRRILATSKQIGIIIPRWSHWNKQ